MELRRASILASCLALAFVTVAGTASAQVSCSGIAAFTSCTAYASGAKVTYNGSLYHSIASIPSNRDCPPNSPYNPSNDNWWVNDGTCSTTSTATATATRTATATATTARATATATRTPTATATSGSSTATATRTNTATATRTSTATATAGSSSSSNYTAAYWTQGNDPCTSSGPAGSGQPWGLPTACTTNCAAAWVSSTAYNGGAVVSRSCGGSTATATATRTPTATATSSGPTPTRTNTPTATATSNQNIGSLPAKVITGYWQDFCNGATVVKLRDVPTKYNLIAVAFANATGTPGAVSYSLDSCLGYSGNSEFITDISTAKGRGQHVIISVGGQNGTISVSDSTSAANFANSVVSLMNTFGFEGVDIDLENGISSFMTTALNSIRSQKPGAIITMAPQTIDMQNMANIYPSVAKNANVDIVNTQFYNSGCMLGCDGVCYSQGTEDFLTMLACIQVAPGGLRGDQVGFGVPASASAAGGGLVSPSVVNAAMNCMKSGTSCSKVPANRAAVRGAMTWSINWDAVQGYSWVNGITVP